MHERLHGLLAWFHHESISTDRSWLRPPPRAWFLYVSMMNVKEPLFTEVTVNRGLAFSLRCQWLSRWCHQRGHVLLREVSVSPGRATVQIFTGYQTIVLHQCFIEHYELLPLRCRGENLSLVTYYKSKRIELRLALDSKVFPSSHGRVKPVSELSGPRSHPQFRQTPSPEFACCDALSKSVRVVNYSPQHVALPD